jgi:hypothetical protein
MILGFIGELGAGKTLNAVLWSQYLKKISGNKLDIYANFYIFNAKRFYSIDELLNISNSIIVYDEIHQDINSRTWWQNNDIINFFLQLRKRNNFLIFTTQNIKQVDIRLRNITNFLFYCLKQKNKIKVYIFDFQNNILKNNYYLDLRELKGLNFFSLYNTFEIVKPLEREVINNQTPQ